MELNDAWVRWLVLNSVYLLEDIPTVATMGGGPVEENEFDESLRSIGFEVLHPGPGSEVMVVGREGWDGAELRRILDARAGQQLRVYSQEMFTAFLISGSDPLLEPDETILELADDHPALDFLRAVGFHWPSTEVTATTSQHESSLELQPTSPLKYFGYGVGDRGLGVSERRRILTRVYESQLPEAVFSRAYLAKWGPPASTLRLKSMANLIASQSRLRKRQSDPPIAAISDWENDLEWLRHSYYEQHARFRWPSTEVG